MDSPMFTETYLVDGTLDRLLPLRIGSRGRRGRKDGEGSCDCEWSCCAFIFRFFRAFTYNFIEVGRAGVSYYTPPFLFRVGG